MMENVCIGVDIAKDKLDIAIIRTSDGGLLEQLVLPNTAAGHAALITLVSRYQEARIVMEATGTYHRRLSKALFEADLAHSVINPLQLKRFAQMKLRRLKTDRSDALLLAQYGREQKPPLHRMEGPVQQQLKQLNTHVEQLVKQRTALLNMAHADAQSPAASQTCKQVLEGLLSGLEAGLAALVAAQEELIEQAYGDERVLIESVVGVGRRTTYALLAYLGDLAHYERHGQVVAYLGLNPVPKESGTSLQAARHISKQGNAQLRTLFYLCALSAKRHNKSCRQLYERMKGAGKPEKVALIAVANKLVKQVFTVVKRGVLFDNDYLEKMNRSA